MADNSRERPLSRPLPVECSDCGYLEPDGLCETCKPCVIYYPGGEERVGDPETPSIEDMLTTLRVISHYQTQVSTPGQIHLVKHLRDTLEKEVRMQGAYEEPG